MVLKAKIQTQFSPLSSRSFCHATQCICSSKWQKINTPKFCSGIDHTGYQTYWECLWHTFPKYPQEYPLHIPTQGGRRCHMIDSLMLGDEGCELTEEAKGWDSAAPCKVHQQWHKTLELDLRTTWAKWACGQGHTVSIWLSEEPRQWDAKSMAFLSLCIFSFFQAFLRWQPGSPPPFLQSSLLLTRWSPTAFGFGQHWIFMDLNLKLFIMSIHLIGAGLVLKDRISWNVLKASSV